METQTAPPKVEEKVFFEDYVYELSSINKGEELNLNEKSKIFLVINGQETNIPIQELFLNKELNIDSEDIRGFSILNIVKNNKLKIDADTILDIALIDKTSGKQFHISNIRRPNAGIIWSDPIEATPTIRLAYIDLLLSGNVSGNAVDAEAIAKAEAKAKEEAEAIAKAEAKAKEEAEAKAKEEAEAIEAANKELLGGPEWEAKRKELLDEGFSEYKKYDYRFFAKKDGEIDFYALEKGDFVPVALEQDEITDEKETYLFEDSEDDEWVLIFNKVSDKITIREVE